MISLGMFALDYSISASSSIIIGGYDETKVAADDINWMDLTDYNYWQVNLTMVQINDQILDITNKLVVFDSGSSLTYLNSSDYNVLTSHIFSSKTDCYFDSSYGGTLCSCTSTSDPSFPTVSLTLN